jgi:hypothetical protein
MYNAVLIYFGGNVEAATPADIASQSFAPIPSIWHFLRINESTIQIHVSEGGKRTNISGRVHEIFLSWREMSCVKYYSSVDKDKPLY